MKGDVGFAGEGGDRLPAVADEIFSPVTTPASAAPIEALSSCGRTASKVAPRRSRATRTGMLSEWRPGCLAGPPRLLSLARQIRPPALEGFKDEGFVHLDDSAQFSGLVGARSAQKPMPPAKRRRRMHSAKLGRPGQAFALDHRPSVVEPTLPFVQMRHRRLGERIEGAPAALAAEPRKPMRASPGDDRSSCAMGTALARHALMAARPQSIRTTTPLRAVVPRPAGRGGLRFSRPSEPAIQIRQSGRHFPALLDAQPPNARKQTENSSAFIYQQVSL